MKINIFLLLTVALSSAGVSSAQSVNDVGKIALSIVAPQNADGLDASQLSKLKIKISQIVTASGLAASGHNNNFLIHPEFSVYESNIVEGGMQNITVVKVEFSLSIKQADNNVVFSTTAKMLKGSGINNQLAISNAISAISPSDKDFKIFIEAAKHKILQYYESKCGDIVQKSERYIKEQRYEQAIGLLMTVPEEITGCYKQVQSKAFEAYNAYQTKKCTELLQKANALFVTKDYDGALQVLTKIDPYVSCFNNSQALAKKIEEKVQAENAEKKDFLMKRYQDSLAFAQQRHNDNVVLEKQKIAATQQQHNADIVLEKQRIAAIKEIAVAYYSSQE